MLMKMKLRWYSTKVDVKKRQGVVEGLTDATENVLEKSNRVVPFDVGTPGLFSSGTPSVDPNELRGAVSYNTPYAVYQHEDLTLHHEDGRKAKYLEDVINDPRVRKQTERLIADAIRRRFGG